MLVTPEWPVQFVQKNLGLYHLLLEQLGDPAPQGDLETLARHIMSLWLGRTPGTLPPTTQQKYSQQMLVSIWPTLRRTGLFNDHRLRSAVHLKRVFFEGGTLDDMVRQLRDNGLLWRTQEIMYAFGSRARQDRLDGTLPAIKRRIEEAGIGHISWVCKQMTKNANPFATQFELGILSLYLVYGVSFEIGQPGHDGTVQNCRLDGKELTLVNTQEFAKRYREQWPVTRNTLYPLLLKHFPLATGKIGIVADCPRSMWVAYQVARQLQRTPPFTTLQVHGLGTTDPQLIYPQKNTADRRPAACILGLETLARILCAATETTPSGN